MPACCQSRRRRQQVIPEPQPSSFGSILFDEVLIKEQMQLVESRARNLPVKLHMEVAKGHGVGQQLVELFGHLQADRFFKIERQDMIDCPVLPDLACLLVKLGAACLPYPPSWNCYFSWGHDVFPLLE
jgi:hypothetical protein